VANHGEKDRRHKTERCNSLGTLDRSVPTVAWLDLQWPGRGMRSRIWISGDAKIASRKARPQEPFESQMRTSSRRWSKRNKERRRTGQVSKSAC